ncbi:HlyC/CorC family transporter [bacterium]|nr:HlyC/CorC family transporter [bacterium]
MDTDIPLSALLLLDQISFTGGVMVVFGLLACFGSALAANSAVAGRIARLLRPEEIRRTVAGGIVQLLLGFGLLLFGLGSVVNSEAEALREALDPAYLAGSELDGWALGIRIGLALLPALLLPAIGVVAGAVSARGERMSWGIRGGQILAEPFAKWLPAPTHAEGEEEAEPEFRIDLASGEDVEDEERELIENILEFGETTCSEVMTPRTDFVAVDNAWEGARIIAVITDSRHSRFPVYEESIDNVIGILHIRDLLEYLARGGSSERLDLRQLVREPVFYPASKKIDDVMRDLQIRKSHMAIVLDEYGGTSGMVTIEDLLEEIVGEIQDEYDDESRQIHRMDDGSWIVDAQCPLSDLNEELGLSLEAEDVDTLGGFIANQLGRIPEESDTVDAGEMQLRVLSVDRNRIRRVRVQPLGGASVA